MTLQDIKVKELREMSIYDLRDIRSDSQSKIDDNPDAGKDVLLFWIEEDDIARCEIARREGRI